MQTIELHEVELHLEELVAAAAQGEPFIIAKEGKAMVQVTGVAPQEKTSAKKPLVFGSLAGKMSIPDDFDTMYAAEIQAMFENDGKL